MAPMDTTVGKASFTSPPTPKDYASGIVFTPEQDKDLIRLSILSEMKSLHLYTYKPIFSCKGLFELIKKKSNP